MKDAVTHTLLACLVASVTSPGGEWVDGDGRGVALSPAVIVAVLARQLGAPTVVDILCLPGMAAFAAQLPPFTFHNLVHLVRLRRR